MIASAEASRAHALDSGRHTPRDRHAAIDSNRAIWQALNNEYWPADYFIDGKGAVKRLHQNDSLAQQLLVVAIELSQTIDQIYESSFVRTADEHAGAQ